MILESFYLRFLKPIPDGPCKAPMSPPRPLGPAILRTALVHYSLESKLPERGLCRGLYRGLLQGFFRDARSLDFCPRRRI